MYDDGRVLAIGGANPPTAAAETIDLSEPTPAWRLTAPMSVPRRQINANLLPDGTVLATGGTRRGREQPRRRGAPRRVVGPGHGPAGTTLAAMHHPRLYHSIALPPPDARVLVGAGRIDRPAGNTNLRNVEFFSPPYLFRGVRPVISSAPERVAYGSTFLVGTPDAVTGATLIGLGAVTHGFDQSQRINRLRVTPGLGCQRHRAGEPQPLPAGALHALPAERPRRPVGRPNRPGPGKGPPHSNRAIAPSPSRRSVDAASSQRKPTSRRSAPGAGRRPAPQGGGGDSSRKPTGRWYGSSGEWGRRSSCRGSGGWDDGHDVGGGGGAVGQLGTLARWGAMHTAADARGGCGPADAGREVGEGCHRGGADPGERLPRSRPRRRSRSRRHRGS